MRTAFHWVAGLGVFLLVASASAGEIVLQDPTGDDNGPGNYTYPTDSVYRPGSFDMTKVSIEDNGSNIDVRVTFAARIEDPWRSTEWNGNGFSLQMVFLFIDTDHKAGSGHVAALPGLNVNFDEASRWEKCLVISPQGTRRLQQEIRGKARGVRQDIVLPTSVKVRGRAIVATFSKADVGGAPSPTWGYQALVQSNEGYPRASDFLTRPVNEYNGAHRFGGGSDFDCDPHVIDMLAGRARGDGSETAAQHAALKGYECTDDPDAGKQAFISMVYPGS